MWMKRLFALDVLRGVAICLVLAIHSAWTPESPDNWFEPLFGAFQSIGWVGVDLFFALSGFLISGLLFVEFNRSGRLHIGQFYLRRGLKIWPSFYFAFGSVVLLQCLRQAQLQDWDRVTAIALNTVPNILFVQNYLTDHPWPHSWSLAVEEHFYLFLPVVLMLMCRGSKDGKRAFCHLLWSLPLVWVMSLAYRVLAAATGEATPHYLYYSTHAHLDGFLVGVTGGYLFHYRRPWAEAIGRWWPMFAFVAVFAMALVWRYPRDDFMIGTTVGFSMLSIGFGGLVLAAGLWPDTGKQAPLRLAGLLRGIAWLGCYSYTIYLAHSVIPMMPGFEPLRQAVIYRGLPGWLPAGAVLWIDRLVFWGLAVGAGFGLSLLIEQPFLRFRNRLVPSHPRTPTPGSEIPHRRTPNAGVPTIITRK
jgi:peptidoglycan/LPS O-acetylase OafA/YrhL